MACDEGVLRPAGGSGDAAVGSRRCFEIQGDGAIDRRSSELSDRDTGQANLDLRDAGVMLESMQGSACLPSNEQCRQQQKNSCTALSSHVSIIRHAPWEGTCP